jgi:poly(A) polymerase
MVESRLRQLVMKLEMVENLEIAHPHIKSFDHVYTCYTQQESDDVAHGMPLPPREDPPDESQKRTVYTSIFYIGLAVKPKDPTSNAPRKLDISWPATEFMKLVKGWDHYDETTMGIVVRHLKR